jgi:serine/threonine protein phosphatase PrpC
MKHQEFNQSPLPPTIQLKEGIATPYLLSEPAIHVRMLRPGDQFVVLATDGLWDLLSNQEVVDIVAHHSREVIAHNALFWKALHLMMCAAHSVLSPVMILRVQR